MKLTKRQLEVLRCATENVVEEIVRDQQRRKQRLVPLREAQQIAEAFDRIKRTVEFLLSNWPHSITVGDVRASLRDVERECNHAILDMKAHFEVGKRKRPRP